MKPVYLAKIVSAAVVLAALGATVALAGPIEDRQAAMKANGKAIGVLAAIFKGEAAYDAAVVKTNAAASLDAMKKAFANFPAGSDKGPPETWAKAEIWSDPEGFKAAQDKALNAVEAVATTNDEDGFKTALAAAGNACGACHDKFRRPKE